MADKTPWRRLFDQVERTIGQPLESVVNTPEFASAMAVGKRLQQSIEQQTAEFFATALHRIGMPALQDVTELSRSLGRVERRLQQLSHELEIARDAEGDRPESDRDPQPEPTRDGPPDLA